MKKKIISIMALVLILALSVAVFSSCAKKEEAKEETAKMNITIVNKTGETVKNITFEELSGSKKQKWETAELANDEEITVTIDTVVEKEAPNLQFSYGVESGNAMHTVIVEKGDKNITLKVVEDGRLGADIVTK